MFVDFDDIFNDNPQSQFKIPIQCVNYLNTKLPNGIKYKIDEDGNCTITSDDNKVKIGGIKLTPNKEQKKILGNKYKLSDILDYSYNSQQKIKIDLLEDGYITLNGEKFPIDRITYNPLNPIKIVEDEIFLIPSKLDEKINLKLGDGKYEREMQVSRIPDNSINTIAFSSDENKPLKINYKINLSNNELKLNMAFDLKYANTIRDVVESVYIYNAFLDGKGYIGDTLINNINIDSKNSKKYDENSALFWEKVLMIEEELNAKFIPPTEDVDYEKMLEVEELYQSLIMKKPVRDKNVISSINANWDLNKEKEIESYINQNLFFRFNGSYFMDIFGFKKELPALLMVFNSKLLKIEKKEETTIFLGDESEEQKRYTSVMCFKNNEELEKYEKESESDKIQLFKDAKRAYEYLDK